MDFPEWFRKGMEARFDHIVNQMEQDPELEMLREKERNTFNRLIQGISEYDKTLFLVWEERHRMLIAEMKERLYLQGLRDGKSLFGNTDVVEVSYNSCAPLQR